jgi:hypothetical protein
MRMSVSRHEQGQALSLSSKASIIEVLSLVKSGAGSEHEVRFLAIYDANVLLVLAK